MSMTCHRIQPARSTSGSALVMALIVVTLVASLGAGFLHLSASVTRRQTGEVETTRAFYLAEAGLAEAFQALRIGRSGQVGSEEAPAAYGDGVLWVDAIDTADDQVRLTSTALCGSGRASLSYVVEPIEVPLGFFSEEDLVVDSVLLVDGWNSEEGSYGPQEAPIRVGGVNYRVDTDGSFVGQLGYLAPAAVPPGAKLITDTSGRTYYIPEWSRHLAGSISSNTWTDYWAAQTGWTASEYYAGSASPDGDSSSPVAATTGSGGLLGSNGDVSFTMPSGEPVEVWGDVVPGPSGTVQEGTGVAISGSTTPRTAAVELPPVEVPEVGLQAAVRHEDLLPMLVSAGASGYERIEVAADSELVLRGPSTVVIGNLVLEPGASLTLDTRDGDVELYVTGGMDLQPDSIVTTTGDRPDELSIQVAAIPSDASGAPVQLEATSQFHGTIYAPETEVQVGGDFEVYGGIVARKLEIGSGARLHFDNAGLEGTPIPRIISWRIVEVPAAVRGRRRDPFTTLGVERADLESMYEAHDLAAVTLTIEYLDHGGSARTYDGSEEAFDWNLVAQVLEIDRKAMRPNEDPTADGTTEDPTPDPLLDLVNDLSLSSSELSSELQARSPLSTTVLHELLVREPPMAASDLYNVLKKNGPPVSGYVDGLGSGPLPDDLLLDVIQYPYYDSKSLSWTLEQSSPLSPEVLQAARDRDPPMKTADLGYLERAQ